MTNFLVKLFVKNSQEVKDPHVRQSYGLLGGGVGIFCNLLLFSLKIIIGMVTNSMAVIADAFNNLSDMGSSVATIVGFKMTNKPADKEHPFGHGRSEYITAMFIALMILVVGVQFVRNSIERILHPQPLAWKFSVVIMLGLTILVKLWMASFNKTIGRKIGSMAMEATSFDSLSDVLITGVVMLSLVLSHIVSFPVDGYISLGVALFILYSGYKITKETLNPLLGEANDEELSGQIESELHGTQGILGSHDLLIHNYGPGRCIATVHVEVSDQLSLVEAHGIIDQAERSISEKLRLELIIHLDPVNVTDRRIMEMEDTCRQSLKKISQDLDMHDFMVLEEGGAERISFDMTLPYGWSKEQETHAMQEIELALAKDYPSTSLTIRVDRR